MNVRRLLFVLEKRIRAECGRISFDPYDEIFCQNFIDIATSILREIGLNDFIIQFDESNAKNLPIFRARVGIRLALDAKFIFIEFDFSQYWKAVEELGQEDVVNWISLNP